VTPPREVLVVHGGVDTPDTPSNRAGVARAALLGGKALARGRLDAVEGAIRVLEAAPAFNAGYGAVLNRLGDIELDALIVDGVSRRAGAVAAIQNVAHPVSIARLVLETSEYVLLAGTGATRFAREQGVPVEHCETFGQREAWQRATAGGGPGRAGLHPFTGLPMPARGCDTVGAVAVTRAGTAAGVSTGGLFLKVPGRVGDSAVPGAGAWASPAGAAAGTGLGEAFIELQLSRSVVSRLEHGVHPQDAVEEALHELLGEYAAIGGLIALDSEGRIGAAHSGTCMPVGAFALDGGGLLPIASTPLPGKA
jgi:L-asparaginase / beta-aspartyl-peptidase